jgi:hypothetical protein
MQQHFMAFTGLAVPLAIVFALFVRVPLPVVMMAWLPAIPTLAMIFFECAALKEFGRDHGFTIRLRDYVRLMISTPFYQLLLAVAAIRAAIKFQRGDFGWEKTAHSGAHLTMVREIA